MSVTSDELNYLIWRYLQESGHELSTYALQRETRAHLLDEQFSKHISIGALVSIVQKGIQYMEVEASVKDNGDVEEKFGENKSDNSSSNNTSNNNINNEDRPFTLFGALHIDEEKLEEEAEPVVEKEKAQEKDVSIPVPVKPLSTLESIYSTGPSEAAEWSPTSPQTLVIAQQDRSASLLVFPGFNKNISNKTLLPSHSIKLLHSALDYGHHDKEVTVVSWNSLGTLVATASFDGQVRIWTSEGKLRHTLLLHRDPVLVIKWNEPNTMLLSVDCSNTVVVWDAYSGEVRQTFSAANGNLYDIKPLTQSSNSQSTAINSNNPTTVNTSIPSQPPTSIGTDACWIDPLTYATTADNATIVIYKISERGPLLKFRGHTQGINCLLYEPRSQLLASASDDHTVRVWYSGSNSDRGLDRGLNKPTSSVVMLTGHTAPVVSVKWLPPVGPLGSLDPSAFGGSFVSISNNNTSLNANSNNINTINNNNSISSLTSPISSQPIPQSQQVSHQQHPSSSSPFSGPRLASASLDGTIRIWDPTRSLCLSVLSLHSQYPYNSNNTHNTSSSSSSIFALEVSPNGKFLAAGGLDGVLVIWDISKIGQSEDENEVNGNGTNGVINVNGGLSDSGFKYAVARFELKKEMTNDNKNVIKKENDEPNNANTNINTKPDDNKDHKENEPSESKDNKESINKKRPNEGNTLDNGSNKRTKPNDSSSSINDSASISTSETDDNANSVNGGGNDGDNSGVDTIKKNNHINSIAWNSDSSKICICFGSKSVVVDTSSLGVEKKSSGVDANSSAAGDSSLAVTGKDE